MVFFFLEIDGQLGPLLGEILFEFMVLKGLIAKLNFHLLQFLGGGAAPVFLVGRLAIQHFHFNTKNIK